MIFLCFIGVFVAGFMFGYMVFNKPLTNYKFRIPDDNSDYVVNYIKRESWDDCDGCGESAVVERVHLKKAC